LSSQKDVYIALESSEKDQKEDEILKTASDDADQAPIPSSSELV